MADEENGGGIVAGALGPFSDLAPYLAWTPMGATMGWFEEAIALLGDLVDPFLPGFAGSNVPAGGNTAMGTITGGLGAGDRTRRHRRKQVLTASDRADIAFISGTLGKAAGRDFAMIVAARKG